MREFNETIESDFKDNPLVGTAGLYQKYTRKIQILKQ